MGLLTPQPKTKPYVLVHHGLDRLKACATTASQQGGWCSPVHSLVRCLLLGRVVDPTYTLQSSYSAALAAQAVKVHSCVAYTSGTAVLRQAGSSPVLFVAAGHLEVPACMWPIHV